jgi:hypothetical protein
MNRIIRWALTLALVLALALPVAARRYRFRVCLADKASTAASLAHPEDYLSPTALARRARQHLPVDSTDLPVSAAYLQALSRLDARPVTVSKWNNTVVMESTDSLWPQRLAALPYVKGVRRVWAEPDSVLSRDNRHRRHISNHF